MAHLIIRQADGDGVRFPLEKARTLIGSGAFNDLTLPLAGLGPTHLEIACACDSDRRRFEARPLVGRAVAVNGRPVDGSRILADGDRLAAGGVTIEFRADDRNTGSVGTLVIGRRSPGQAAKRRFFLKQNKQSIEIPATGLTVGSAPSCDIALQQHQGVSRLHFRIVPGRDGRLFLRDLGSTNGTLVDGVRLIEGEVVENNIIVAGTVRFKVGVWGETDTLRLVGSSLAMDKVRETIDLVARSREPVLIIGETGTGKELVAQDIHDQSPRSNKPFLPVNCAALSAGLLESELFGHRKGAFTGAVTDRKGVFARADGGTVFLDEIGELQPELQAKLLRVLEGGEIRPVGSDTAVRVDCRIVAATNRNLRGEVAARRFREDLFYRLYVVPIHLPALRDRREDIPELVRHFATACGVVDLEIEAGALEALLNYPWPGNVRQLKNMVARTVLLNRDLAHGAPLRANHLVFDESADRLTGGRAFDPGSAAEDALVTEAFGYFKGNVEAVAKALAIPQAQVRVLMMQEPKSQEPKSQEPKSQEPKSQEPKSGEPKSIKDKVRNLLAAGPLSKVEIAESLGQKVVSGRLKEVFEVMLKEGIIAYTTPGKPRSRLQKYRLISKRRHDG